jgi:hypothetical protein
MFWFCSSLSCIVDSSGIMFILLWGFSFISSCLCAPPEDANLDTTYLYPFELCYSRDSYWDPELEDITNSYGELRDKYAVDAIFPVTASLSMFFMLMGLWFCVLEGESPLIANWDVFIWMTDVYWWLAGTSSQSSLISFSSSSSAVP